MAGYLSAALREPLLSKEDQPKPMRETLKFVGSRLKTSRTTLRRKDTLIRRSITEAKVRVASESRSKFLVSREGPFMQSWYPWMSCLINYSVLTTMYYLAYEEPGQFLITVDRIVWVMFAIDMVLEMCTDFRDSEGVLVESHIQIILRYMRGWFLFDLLSLMPMSEFGYHREEYYMRMIRFLKIQRGLELFNGSLMGPALILILRPKNVAEIQNVTVMVKYLISFMQIMGSMLFTTYALAASFFWWSNVTLAWDNAQNTHFIEKFHMEEKSGVQLLLHSCYFLATTLATVGYGDYYATNTYEKVLLIGVLLIGISQFSLIVANFNNLLLEIDENTKTGERMDDLTTWIGMLENSGQKFSAHIKDLVVKHFKYYWENDRLQSLAMYCWSNPSLEELVVPTDKYLLRMPEDLRKGVINFLFSDLGVKYTLFFSFDAAFRRDITFHFQPRFYHSEEVIIGKDEEVQEVIFVTKGIVSCGVNTAKGFQDLLFYRHTCIIGDYEALHEKPAIASYRAIGKHGVKAFMLPAHVVATVLKARHPRHLIKLLMASEAKATFIRSTLKKYIDPKTQPLKNYFQQLQDRIMAQKGNASNQSQPEVTPEGGWTRKELIEQQIEYERRRANYEARKSELLTAILKKVATLRGRV